MRKIKEITLAILAISFMNCFSCSAKTSDISATSSVSDNAERRADISEFGEQPEFPSLRKDELCPDYDEYRNTEMCRQDYYVWKNGNEDTYSIELGSNIMTTGVVVMPSLYQGKKITSLYLDNGAISGKAIILPQYLEEICLSDDGTGRDEDSMEFHPSSYTHPKPMIDAGYVWLPDTLNHFSKYAFMYNTDMTYIYLPDSVTELVDYSFYGCTGLKDVYVPDSLSAIGEYAFYSTGLTEFSFSHIQHIGAHAFCRTALKTVNLPKKMEYYSGFDCLEDVSITYPEECEVIGKAAFQNQECDSLYFPKGLKRIEEKAFYGGRVSHVTGTLTLPEGLEEVSGFECNRELTEVILPSTVRTVGGFGLCSSLSRINLDDVTVIKDYAFENCPLTDVNMQNVTHIGDCSFKCTSLEKAIIPNATYIDNKAFYRCSSIDEVVFGDHLDYLGIQSFYGCDSVKEVRMPRIGKLFDGAAESSLFTGFVNCNGLGKVTFGDDVETAVGFFNCPNLKEAVFPSSVKRIYGFINTQVPLSSIPEQIEDLAGFNNQFKGKETYILNGHLVHLDTENCMNETEIVVPEGVTTINAGSIELPLGKDEQTYYSLNCPDSLENFYSPFSNYDYLLDDPLGHTYRFCFDHISLPSTLKKLILYYDYHLIGTDGTSDIIFRIRGKKEDTSILMLRYADLTDYILTGQIPEDPEISVVYLEK